MVSSVIVQYTQRNKTCRTTCREIWTIHLVTGHILGMTVSSWIKIADSDTHKTAGIIKIPLTFLQLPQTFQIAQILAVTDNGVN